MSSEPNATNERGLRGAVAEYYGRILASSADLKTNACCAAGPPPEWIAARLANVHQDVTDRFYGCGYPIPHAVQGGTVIDLGCGTGRDVYVLSQLVGPDGVVHGIDMTEEQLAVARATVPWHAERFGYVRPNTIFHSGFIEDLKAVGIGNATCDLVVSNCVVNLSPRKDLVLGEAFRVLKPGGELYMSDVFVDRRLPAAVARDPLLHAECLGGALYEADFASLCKKVGFVDPRVLASSPIVVANKEIAEKVGAARFRSVTYRLFKLNGLDEGCEDYGQSARYLGGIEGAEHVFWLDDHHAFERGRPERVCANTAAMLAHTRFARFFEVAGARDVHFGAFPCGPTIAAGQHDRSSSGREASGCC